MPCGGESEANGSERPSMGSSFVSGLLAACVVASLEREAEVLGVRLAGEGRRTMRVSGLARAWTRS
jgi:hypothetical protein